MSQASPSELLAAIATARVGYLTTQLIERKLVGGPAPVFSYLFDYALPMPSGTAFPGRSMSAHGFELPFVFGLADRIELAGDRPDRIELANLMSGLWAEFVRSGTPGPEWPPYELADRKTMVFDTNSRVELDPLGGERALLSACGPCAMRLPA